MDSKKWKSIGHIFVVFGVSTFLFLLYSLWSKNPASSFLFVAFLGFLVNAKICYLLGNGKKVYRLLLKMLMVIVSAMVILSTTMILWMK